MMYAIITSLLLIRVIMLINVFLYFIKIKSYVYKRKSFLILPVNCNGNMSTYTELLIHKIYYRPKILAYNIIYNKYKNQFLLQNFITVGLFKYMSKRFVLYVCGVPYVVYTNLHTLIDIVYNVIILKNKTLFQYYRYVYYVEYSELYLPNSAIIILNNGTVISNFN